MTKQIIFANIFDLRIIDLTLTVIRKIPVLCAYTCSENQTRAVGRSLLQIIFMVYICVAVFAAACFTRYAYKSRHKSLGMLLFVFYTFYIAAVLLFYACIAEKTAPAVWLSLFVLWV